MFGIFILLKMIYTYIETTAVDAIVVVVYRSQLVGPPERASVGGVPENTMAVNFFNYYAQRNEESVYFHSSIFMEANVMNLCCTFFDYTNLYM